MKITQYELIEFADEQELQIFGKKENILISKTRMLRRLVEKGLLPKPNNEGGKSSAYWENDAEIRDRVIWLDEQKKKGKSYRQMKEELNYEGKKGTFYDNVVATRVLSYSDELLEIDNKNYGLIFIKSVVCFLVGERDKSLEILEDLEDKCKDKKELLFIIYRYIAWVSFNLGKKETQLNACKKLLQMAKEIGSCEKTALACSEMGKYFQTADVDIEKSLEYYQRSLDVLKDSNSRISAIVYGDMSNLFLGIKEYHKAEEYLKKAIEVSVKINDKRNEVMGKLNLGIIYYELNQLPEALNIFKEVHYAFSVIHDLDIEEIVIGRMGMVYNRMGLFSKAIENLRHAYHIATIIKDPNNHVVWLKELSNVYKEMGNLNKSNFYLEESKKIEKNNIK